VKIADLVRAMEALAPPQFAAAWDNVGLLVGDAGASLSGVLLTIDCTREVLSDAAREGKGAIVSYHPPIFDPQKRFVAPSIAYEAARAGIAVYSPHTALDVAEGGTNDVLADAIGMTGRIPLRACRPDAPDESALKLVTFVPEGHVEAVSRAVFDAGAGTIGKYSSCSFRTPGVGTFFGEEGASPVVGQAGRLENAAEVKLETVVPRARVDAVVRALRGAHPYEEPAFDLLRLATHEDGRGFGRVGSVTPATARALVDRVKAAVGASHVLSVGDLDRHVSRAAVCAGSGGDLLADAIDAGAELFLTGELRHHDALRAASAGMIAVCVLHSTSERIALASLEKALADRLPGVSVARSREDREPFAFV
jgi:dinuclear metal center YbgI/SA1388 family protein